MQTGLALAATHTQGSCTFSLLVDDDVTATAEFYGGEYVEDTLEVELNGEAVDWDLLLGVSVTYPGYFADTDKEGKPVSTPLTKILIGMCMENSE